MSKAGAWTASWIVVVCVAGGARLIKSAPHGAGPVGSESEEIATAHRLGAPIDVADLPPTPFPDNQNAVGVYNSIGIAFRSDTALKKTLDDVGMSQPRPDAGPGDIAAAKRERDKADAALPSLKPIFQLADAIESYPRTDFGPLVVSDGNPSFDSMNTARTLTKTVIWRADYQDRQGDWKGALASMRLAGRISVDVGSNGGLTPLFSEAMARAMVRREYGILAQRHSKDLAFLTAEGAQIAAQRSLPDMRRCLIESVVTLRPELRSITSLKQLQDEFGIHTSESDSITDGLLTGTRLQNELDARLISAWNSLWPQLPKDSKDWQAYHTILKAFSDRLQADNSELNALNQDEFSELASTADKVGQIQASDRLLLDSVMLLKVRAETGGLPVLLPRNLGEDRIDPFDGNPLRYRLDGTGFILYSVGSDREDNGGHRRGVNEVSDKGSDIVESFS